MWRHSVCQIDSESFCNTFQQTEKNILVAFLDLSIHRFSRYHFHFIIFHHFLIIVEMLNARHCVLAFLDKLNFLFLCRQVCECDVNVVLATQILRNDRDIHSGTESFKNLFCVIGRDLDFLQGLFGHERLDKHPSSVCETAGVDDHEPMLPLRSVIERVTQIPFGDCKLKVIGTQVTQIPNYQHLIYIPPHLGPQVDLQIVNVIIAIPFNARQFVNFDPTGLAQYDWSAHKVLSNILIGPEGMVLLETIQRRVPVLEVLLPFEVLQNSFPCLFEVVFLCN